MSAGINLRAHLSGNGVDEELRRVIAHFADSAKYISSKVHETNRAKAGTKNIYGEEQLALDVAADRMILKRLEDETSFGINQLASEEADEIISIDPKLSGNYSVTVDPLDGSSLVDVNFSVGTIIGIHKGSLTLDNRSGKDDLVAAMYIQYGPATTMIYTSGDGVHEFFLDREKIWTLKKEEPIKMKEKGNIYSPGGLKADWTDKHHAFIDELESEGYKLRYSGGFVPDINQILMKGGGLFTYPALKNAPNGKLRLLVELQPMAMIMEHAGGKATNGLENILDIIPEGLEQRSAVYIGSEYEVEKAKEFLR
jgi:fructose-1,6-bisphosphatase I